MKLLQFLVLIWKLQDYFWKKFLRYSFHDMWWNWVQHLSISIFLTFLYILFLLQHDTMLVFQIFMVLSSLSFWHSLFTSNWNTADINILLHLYLKFIFFFHPMCFLPTSFSPWMSQVELCFSLSKLYFLSFAALFNTDGLSLFRD